MQQADEVIQTAERISKELEKVKGELIEKFGVIKVSSFIKNSIDPMIKKAQELINEIGTKGEESENFENVLTQAAEIVKHYERLSDATKLTEEIITEGKKNLDLIINKDVTSLKSYLFQECSDLSESSEFKQKIRQKLESEFARILSQLEELTLSREIPDFRDVEDFFDWTKKVVESRETLINHGFLTVEKIVELLGGKKKTLKLEEEGEDYLFAPILSLSIENQAKELSDLTDLETKALSLQKELLEAADSEILDFDELEFQLSMIQDGVKDFDTHEVLSTSSHESVRELFKLLDDIEKLLSERQEDLGCPGS